MTNHIPIRVRRTLIDGRRNLAILSAIAVGDRLIQREMARELGVAVSLVNLAIQRLARQGLVRVDSSHPTRLRYFLTPKGIEEKARLAHAQLESSIAEYRSLRDQVRFILQPHLESGARRFAIWGAGNAAEIAYVCLLDSGLEEISVFATGGPNMFLGRPIRMAGDLVSEEFDRIVIASLDFADSEDGVSADLASRGIPRDKIVRLVTPTGRSTQSAPAAIGPAETVAR